MRIIKSARVYAKCVCIYIFLVDLREYYVNGIDNSY